MMVMNSMLQTRTQISADNHGPYIVVTSYILMSVMILSTIAKLRPNRHTFTKIPRLDECVILLAMVCDIRRTKAALTNIVDYCNC